jgi:uncharacterized protein YdeI (YjbR/CyaY-like superfamily)
MSDKAERFFASCEAWRAWLAQYGQQEGAFWMVFHKKHTGEPCIAYDDALDEALCFGWIDSLIRRIDDDRYARLFSPRRPGSPWSAVNRQRVAKLVSEGRMTSAGMEKIDFDPAVVADEKPQKAPFVLPPEYEQALHDCPPAWENYQKLAPSVRRMYFGWVLSAKKPETRERRLVEVIGVLERGEKLGTK